MTLTGIVLIIISAALCIMVLAFIPTLLAVKRAAISLGALSEMVHTELKPALQELTAALTELRAVGSDVAEHADDVKRFMTALGETGDNLNTINRSVGMVAGVLNATSTWVVGAKVAGKYLLERYLKKRGGK
ncbi:DUF948 domain-containing protein [Oryzomonas sagensis]|uniref:DUF948 domain-containing protein n=1 Tax=Oryzomonas sagensis TaxID=2603857 RepID=A0ABQ6TR83_9BACT|nr:DUF948 domain-containing protein [Oryzomonas sagensis]KAB0671232.1 DUF948 domain-containing protein [Oryzomonas sagensis]